MAQNAQQKRKLLDALKANLGVVETACKAAGIARRTHYNWLTKDKTYAAEVAEIDEIAIDFGESQLLRVMRGYTLPDSKVFLGRDTKQPIVVPIQKHIGPDTSAVIFFLKTRGKKRGYIERSEVDSNTTVQALSAKLELVPAVGGIPVARSEKEVLDV